MRDANVSGAAVPGVRGLHHVAFAVEHIDDALALWQGALGGDLELRAIVASQGVEAACIEWPHGSLVELIAPAPGQAGSTSGVRRFLDARGPCMHHVAWEVADIEQSLAHLRARGARIIDDVPRPGLHGTPVAFVHPASMDGVLVELVQSPHR